MTVRDEAHRLIDAVPEEHAKRWNRIVTLLVSTACWKADPGVRIGVGHDVERIETVLDPFALALEYRHQDADEPGDAVGVEVAERRAAAVADDPLRQHGPHPV